MFGLLLGLWLSAVAINEVLRRLPDGEEDLTVGCILFHALLIVGVGYFMICTEPPRIKRASVISNVRVSGYVIHRNNGHPYVEFVEGSADK